MFTIDGDEKKPLLWVGGSLKHRGQNLYIENLWRVVHSSSRNYIYGGRFADGFTGYRWIPLYQELDCYLLERWLSAMQYAKCTEEGWNILHRDPMTGLNQLGAYPSRGVYFGPCWTFEGYYPTLGAVEKAIDLVIMSDHYSVAEKKAAIVATQEKEEVEMFNQKRDMILDALPLSVTSGKLTNRFYNDAENIPQRYSAQDIQKIKGMPLGANKCFTGGARRT